MLYQISDVNVRSYFGWIEGANRLAEGSIRKAIGGLLYNGVAPKNNAVVTGPQLKPTAIPDAVARRIAMKKEIEFNPVLCKIDHV